MVLSIASSVLYPLCGRMRTVGNLRDTFAHNDG